MARKDAKIPVMVTFDGEWGLSMRLKGAPDYPRNAALGCIEDNGLIEEYGREVARQFRELGVHVNFAPDADVNTNPLNPVIHVRSFGENPQRVAEKVVAYSRGLESGGILSVCKHFPGHGDTDVDSHKALPALHYDRARLDSVELYPFKEMVRAVCPRPLPSVQDGLHDLLYHQLRTDLRPGHDCLPEGHADQQLVLL